jgi:hypothetical protein
VKTKTGAHCRLAGRLEPVVRPGPPARLSAESLPGCRGEAFKAGAGSVGGVAPTSSSPCFFSGSQARWGSGQSGRACWGRPECAWPWIQVQDRRRCRALWRGGNCWRRQLRRLPSGHGPAAGAGGGGSGTTRRCGASGWDSDASCLGTVLPWHSHSAARRRFIGCFPAKLSEKKSGMQLSDAAAAGAGGSIAGSGTRFTLRRAPPTGRPLPPSAANSLSPQAVKLKRVAAASRLSRGATCGREESKSGGE